MGRALLFAAVFLLAGCASSAPRAGDPAADLERGLAAARARAEGARTPAEELRFRRELLSRLLGIGWTPEAAAEYLRIRQLRGGEDATLLRQLCLATLRWGLRDLDPARRLGVLRCAAWLPLPAERLALAELGQRDARPEIRAAAARLVASLAPHEPERVWELLRLSCDDEEQSVRIAALRAGALALSRDGVAAGPGLELLARGFRDTAPEVRAAALRASRALPASLREGLAPEWEALVGNGDLEVAQQAALALAGHDAVRAAAAWSAALQPGVEAETFGRALSLCAASTRGDLVHVLHDLRHRAWRVRLAAALGLRGASGWQRARRELQERVRADANLAVRRAAYETLARASTRGLDRALTRALLADPRPEARQLGFDALARRDRLDAARARALLEEGDPALAPSLLSWLNEHGGGASVSSALSRPALRRAAVETLGRSGSPRAALLGLLASRDPEERGWALRGLSSCAQSEDLPLLVGALARAGEDLAAATAILALSERGGAGTFVQ